MATLAGVTNRRKLVSFGRTAIHGWSEKKYLDKQRTKRLAIGRMVLRPVIVACATHTNSLLSLSEHNGEL